MTHAAVGRGQHEVGVLRRDAVGIAKKVQKKSGEKQEWHGAEGAGGRSRRYRKNCRATDERITRAIDRHKRGLTLFLHQTRESSKKRVRTLMLNQCETAGAGVNGPDGSPR